MKHVGNDWRIGVRKATHDRCFLVVIVVSLAVALLTGCTRAQSPFALKGASVQQKSFVFTGLAGEPDSLNPLLSNEADLRNLSHLYLSHLLESDDRGVLTPEIATRVPTTQNGDISPDGRTIVYHLRRGVRWQDGAPLTARDVVFTYHAVMNPANNVLTRFGYAEIDAIKAPDALTVAIHLRRPFSPILVFFCAPEGFGILPAHLLAKYANLNRAPYNAKPVGSGPFRVVDWRHGDSIVFSANPFYWRGKPRIDRMVYRLIPDPNTRLQQLQTGEADAYFDADPQLLPQLRALRNTRVVLTPVNDIHALSFNLRDPIVGDPRIRQAIAHAIDRDKLLEVATHGSGLRIDGDQPRNGWAYSPGPPLRYDPPLARRLLEAAGWQSAPTGLRKKAGQSLEIALAIAPQGINGATLVATLIQRYLHDVGIGVTIRSYTNSVMWGPKTTGGILQSGRYQMTYSGWWILGPDPDDRWQFACDQMPPAGQNSSFWCNRAAETAMQDAIGSFDRVRRKRDYAVVQTELRHDLPVITLWQVKMPDVHRTELHGFAPSPFGSTFWNAWQWNW